MNLIGLSGEKPVRFASKRYSTSEYQICVQILIPRTSGLELTSFKGHSISLWDLTIFKKRGVEWGKVQITFRKVGLLTQQKVILFDRL